MILEIGLASMLAAAPPGDSCPAESDAGWVASLPPIGPGEPKASPTRTGSGGITRRLSPGLRLCEGDIVRNPVGSNARVRLRLGGILHDVDPGSPPFRVARPRWIARAGRLAVEVMAAVERFRQGSTGFSVTGVRGYYRYDEPMYRTNPPDCGGSSRLRARASRAGSPGDNLAIAGTILQLSWGCGSPRSAYSVEIRGGAVRRRQAVDDRLALDIDRDCPKGCSVVTRPGRWPRVEVPVQVVDGSRLPPDIRRKLEGGSAGRILAGFDLLAADPGWHLLGASLLWENACENAAIVDVTATLYGIADRDAFCRSEAAPAG